MKETERIIGLLEKLYEGSPWIDVNIHETLKKLTAAQAAGRFQDCNSIWEIVNHMINWRLTVLQRIQGKVIPSPANNYFKKVKDISDEAWKKTLTELHDSQIKWVAFLGEFNPADFSSIYPNNKMSYYEHIHGILQHDAYHLGQIRLLMKLV